MKKNIKCKRLDMGLTQYQLADKLGISLRAYQYIERGDRKPNYDVIMKMQDFFHKDVNELLSDYKE